MPRRRPGIDYGFEKQPGGARNASRTFPVPPTEIQNRHKQLVAEQSAILDQLDELEALRTVPGPLGPAEQEQRLLDRWTEIEYAFRVLWYMQQGGELPPGWTLEML
jgi:hypothetical protein